MIDGAYVYWHGWSIHAEQHCICVKQLLVNCSYMVSSVSTAGYSWKIAYMCTLGLSHLFLVL